MAEPRPLFVQLSRPTQTLLQDVCQQQSCTPSQVVEAAVHAFLAPTTPTDRDTLLFQKLAGLETALHGLVPLLEGIIDRLDTLIKPPAPPVATYEQLYTEELLTAGPPEGELVADGLSSDSPRPDGWWRRFFTKRSES
jgi:hypothetical protein